MLRPVRPRPDFQVTEVQERGALHSHAHPRALLVYILKYISKSGFWWEDAREAEEP